MCGIVGVLDARSHESVSPKLIRAMTDALAHRGPDDAGTYIDGNLGLGHRRLSIIDLSSAGHQPMVSADGRVAVSYNGMIYNFMELRSLLQARGHTFVSRCDTEVLVHGWEEWGHDLLPRLNGHFAFALWDAPARRLVLARDRFGTKPLYWADLGGLWLASSEIKAIVAHPSYSPALNLEAMREYFTFQNIFREHTLFAGVNQAPAGTAIFIDADSGRAERWRYWDFDFSRPDRSLTLEDARDQTGRLLSQAVRRQLISDVPVGAYLSGGMDSGSIVSIASRELVRMHTFTAGWHMGGVEGVELNYDERVDAEMMAYTFGTEHYEQVVGAGELCWALPDVVHHLEDLRLGMCYANYYISRLAGKFVRVCLTGTGGDELFGGYPWRYYRVSRSLNKAEFLSEFHAYWQRIVPEEEHAAFFRPAALETAGSGEMQDVLAHVFEDNGSLNFDTPEDHIANSLYFEAKTFLAGLLMLGDKLAMSHALEERHPFLDNDLVDLAQRIPVAHKLKNLDEWTRQDENMVHKRRLYQEHSGGKNVLRLAMERFVPPEVVARKKQGFSSPDGSWYRGPNLDYIRRLIVDRRALLHEYIEPAYIESTLAEHCGQKVNHRLRIWSLLCFELWLRIFIDGQSPEALRVLAARPRPGDTPAVGPVC